MLVNIERVVDNLKNIKLNNIFLKPLQIQYKQRLQK